MNRILLAPNSFKECINSVRIAELLEIELQHSFHTGIYKLPVSDGGDGFLDVCKSLFNLEILTASVSTPYDNTKFDVKYGYSDVNKQIFIESAEVIGLRRIPLEKRHPLLLNSKGLGELVELINKSGLIVEKVTIGVGGTGTSDMGLGFCSVFGLKLFDLSGSIEEIIPENYKNIDRYAWSKPELPFEIELILDVDNPLSGADGAIKAFASQKGATEKDIDNLEFGFAKFPNILKYNNIQVPLDRLSGAGGGLAAGLQLFFDAAAVNSERFILNELLGKIDIRNFDYIVTGEGAFDKQSFLKKGASTIIDYAVSAGKRVFLVCGSIEAGILEKFGDSVIPVELNSFFKTPAESIKNPEKGLKLAAEKIKEYLSA